MKYIYCVFFLFLIINSFCKCNKILSAIIMPFHNKHLTKITENIKLWSDLEPTKRPVQTELIFFSSSVMSQEVDSFLKKYSYLKKYFSEISVQYANLTSNDEYFFGAKFMIEVVLKKQLIFQNDPSYIFYMEPDCLPIQNFWLDGIIDDINTCSDIFWIRGSRFRGNSSSISNGSAALKSHINGNAIYNINNVDFINFYFQKVNPKIGRYDGYDVRIFEALYELPFDELQKYIRFFQYTDVIQNTCSEVDINLFVKNNNNTFLIHTCHKKTN